MVKFIFVLRWLHLAVVLLQYRNAAGAIVGQQHRLELLQVEEILRHIVAIHRGLHVPVPDHLRAEACVFDLLQDNARVAISNDRSACEKRTPLFSQHFRCCPEPVLAKGSFLV